MIWWNRLVPRFLNRSRQRITPNFEGSLFWIIASDLEELLVIQASSHSCKLPQCSLLQGTNKTVSSAKTIWVQEVPKSDTVLSMTVSQDPVHEQQEQNQRRGSPTCIVRHIALALVVRGLKNLPMQPWQLILKPSHPVQSRRSLTGERLTILVTSAKVMNSPLPESSTSTTSNLDYEDPQSAPSTAWQYCIPISGQQFKGLNQTLHGTGTCFHSSSQWMVCQNVQGLSDFLHLLAILYLPSASVVLWDS